MRNPDFDKTDLDSLSDYKPLPTVEVYLLDVFFDTLGDANFEVDLNVNELGLEEHDYVRVRVIVKRGSRFFLGQIAELVSEHGTATITLIRS